MVRPEPGSCEELPVGLDCGVPTGAKLGGGVIVERFKKERQVTVMNILLIVVVVLAVLFFFGGGLVPSLNFLIWVGVVLLILAAVGFFMGRRRT